VNNVLQYQDVGEGRFDGMKRARVWAIVIIALAVAGLASWRIVQMRARPKPAAVPQEDSVEAERIRTELFAQVQPIALTNCQLERFGETNDGGYLLCGNLLGSVQAGYSYGISGYDGWGCQVSRDLNVTVHQYDCFDRTEPVCSGGATVFHGECVAGKASVDENGRRFDTPEHQFARNGDATHRLVVKMDVEGAEWDTFLESPDQVFEQIDQLVVEFHGVNRQPFIEAVKKLKGFYYVANLHFNNYSCTTLYRPFPSWAFEVLFVNKKVGQPDPSGKRAAPSILDTPNNPKIDDCQQ
jgi:hypothetical protein